MRCKILIGHVPKQLTSRKMYGRYCIHPQPMLRYFIILLVLILFTQRKRREHSVLSAHGVMISDLQIISSDEESSEEEKDEDDSD